MSTLFPPQAEALMTDVLNGKNLVLAIPTSSGKTLVAEICMLKAISEGKGKALYLVPLRSLAQEKYHEFKKYETLGIKTALSMGDFDSQGTNLSKADIIVLTTERADSIIRHQAEWIHDIGIIIIDEVHLVNDQTRGPTLEMVTAKLRQILPEVQFVALSATISNADDIAGWLNGNIVRSTWRPVELKEGIYLDGSIKFEDFTERRVPRKRKEELADLACDILEEDGQVLIFVSSRRSTISVCKNIASSIRPYLGKEELAKLSETSKKLDSGPSVPSTTKTLSDLISKGVAFHHAGLSNSERLLVENSFKENLLKVIVATPTLAAGVNLPARRVIIRDYRRFEQGRGSYPIPILEYKQMAGRAGRPKYDHYGEAVLFSRTEQEQEFLLDYYLQSDTEPISSKLASQQALQSHLLSAIATEMTRNRAEIDSLIDGTFYSYQSERWEIDHHVTSALDFLEHGELIETDSTGQYYATSLGQRASKLYIDPSTAILFRDALKSTDSISDIGILHLLCHSIDQPLSYVTKGEVEENMAFIDSSEDHFLVPIPDSWEDPEGYSRFLSEAKTTNVLLDWINEATENTLTDRFNVGMGDIHRYVQSAEWLLYSSAEIARVLNLAEFLPSLQNLRSRVKYGVRKELLELVTLRGIGRVRARMLFSHDVRNLVDLYNIPLVELARIPTIGTTIAKSIKQQVGVDIDHEASEEIVSSEKDENSTTFQALLEDF
ncbi:MAG: DEAD/DEAH box helicase [Candidatus Thorarchaeota archaeon]